MAKELKYIYKMATISLDDIKNIVNEYLTNRKYGKSYEDLVKEYELRDLLIKPEAEIPVTIKNETDRKIYAVYFNLKLCQQLIDYVITYTIENQENIEHAEGILIANIIKAFKVIQEDYVQKCVLEIEKVFKPYLMQIPIVNFDEKMERRVRDFLIIKFLISELTKISEMQTVYANK